MTPRRYDYDDGFDEAALYEDELMFESLKHHRKPKLPRAGVSGNRRARVEDADDEYPGEEHLQRKLARLKAWGAPY